jgi:hypothetical protein
LVALTWTTLVCCAALRCVVLTCTAAVELTIKRMNTGVSEADDAFVFTVTFAAALVVAVAFGIYRKPH